MEAVMVWPLLLAPVEEVIVEELMQVAAVAEMLLCLEVAVVEAPG